MTMKLHILPQSPQCRKVMALIGYLDLPIGMVIKELEELSKDPAYLAMNPNGKVPVLQTETESLWESNVILRYLAEDSGSSLWPQDAASQREVTKWQFWEANHYAPALLGVFFQRVIKQLLGMGEPDPAIVEEKLGFSARFLGILDAELEKRAFIAGSELTIADFSIGVITETANLSGIDISSYDNINAWLSRLRKLKGWNEATPADETGLTLAA